MRERWKPVVGFESYYAVSNLGRVKRTARAPHTRPGYILKPFLHGGYHIVHLSGNGVHFYKKVHRLVIEAFEGPQDDLVVNHKNGIKTDNRWPKNLEYATVLENCHHALRIGLGAIGERSGMAKLTEADVRAIRASKEQGTVLAKKYGVNKQNISNIRLGKSWRHLS